MVIPVPAVRVDGTGDLPVLPIRIWPLSNRVDSIPKDVSLFSHHLNVGNGSPAWCLFITL